MGIKSLAKQALRIMGYATILTLLITVFPSIHTFIIGFKLCQFHNNRIDEGVRRLSRELSTATGPDFYGVAGAPSIRSSMKDAQFLDIPQLRTWDWAMQMGFTLPRYHGIHAWMDDIPIDKIVTFEDAVRDVLPYWKFQRNNATEWWVFASDLPWIMSNPWNLAFRQLLEYHYVNPLPKSTRFAYVSCVDSPFLCSVWQIPGMVPNSAALVHFLVREDSNLAADIDPDAYHPPLENLRPVEVRIIDLGVEADTSPLVPGLFPSRFEQLRSLTTQPGAYTIFEEYVDLKREIKQGSDMISYLLSNRQDQWLAWSKDLDDLTTDNLATPLGLAGALELVTQIPMLLGYISTAIITGIEFNMREIIALFRDIKTEEHLLFDKLGKRGRSKRRGGLIGLVEDFTDYLEEKTREKVRQKCGADPWDDFAARDEAKKEALMAELRSKFDSSHAAGLLSNDESSECAATSCRAN